MFFRWRTWLVFCALTLAAESIFAAGGAKEERAYAAAAAAFQDGLWSRAEAEFAAFVQKYPKSNHGAAAALMQAQAEFKQGKFAEAMSLLSTRKAAAGNLADQYVYWIGETQFQTGDFSAAAETFDSLARDFPESSLRLSAVVEAAAARGKLNAWPRVIADLQNPSGPFQRAAQLDPANELVSRGNLLLAQAKFAQKDFAGATAVLEAFNPQLLKPELDWQREYLLCQAEIAVGNLNAALAASTNLIQIARLQRDDGLRAEGVALSAGVLEKLNRNDEAMAAYAENLTNAASAERQRQAILKIAQLAIAQKQFSDAEQSLEKFLAQFTNSPAADVALLTLGELHLKDYAAQPAQTNELQAARASFDQFLGTFTNSPLAGKALLDRGWCNWLDGKIPESAADFKMALQELPPSEDRAVARFKLGDALFKQGDFAAARENYRAVLEDFADFPVVGKTLGDRALYQILRASEKLNDAAGATNALAQILKTYPNSDLADNASLLVGESLTDLHRPADARALFEDFEKQFPDSELRPQAALAVARTYEEEQNWPAAISQYTSWLQDFPANALRPQAEYARAWANFQAGNETNAFALFTNFVAQFPTNDLAPRAQWWVADYYFRRGGTNFVDAERNYQLLYQNTNWQDSPLTYPARLMAGRAAMGRLGYLDAKQYFTGLINDTNCPPDLNAQALFAYGGTLMLMDSADTNNPLANFQLATNVFGQLCQSYPTNELAARAWCEIGDCNLQLTNYDAATNAYAQAANSPYAGVSVRSRAKIGLGLALEKLAALAPDAGQKPLLDLALQNYADVFYTDSSFYTNSPRTGESPDPFWVKKAGLQAAELAENLGEWPQAVNLYQRMENLLPQLKDSVEKKIAAARAHLPPARN